MLKTRHFLARRSPRCRRHLSSVSHSLAAPARWRRGAALALAGAVLAAPPMARAASGPGRPAADRVVVLGSREPAPADSVAADVVLIDAERIEAAAADSVEDLLRREAGLQLSRNGAPGSNAGVFVRGAPSGHTVVLVDGVRIGSATLGQAGFEGLDLAAIERIEVLRGPASSLYGADAVGGVVQIFTRRGQGPFAARAAAAVGTLGAHEASVSVQGRAGAFDGAASLSHAALDGVSALRPGDAFGNHNPDRDGFRRAGAQLQAGWQPAPGHRVALVALRSRLHSRYDASEFLPPDYAQDASPDFRNRLAVSVLSLAHDAQWSPAWSSRIRLARHDDDLTSGGTVREPFRTRREQAEAQATWQALPGQRTTLAVEHLREQADAAAYTGTATRRTDALVLAHAGRLGTADVQADLRRDRNTGYGGVTTGRLAAALAVAEGWRLRAVAGTTFRAPSFNDLVYPGYGVPTLRPERGRSVEMGLDRRTADWQVSATVFRNRIRDLVAYESDRSFCPDAPDYDFGCARNVARARLQGLTLQGRWRGGPWEAGGTFDLLGADDEATGQRLPRRAPHQLTADVQWRHGAWTLGAALLHLGARPDGGAVLAAETTVDLQARLRLDARWQLEARLANAGNVDTEPVRDYQGLGRQAWIGLRWQGAGL